MAKLIAIWNWLSGKKTYIIGILTIIIGLLQKNWSEVMTGLGLLGLRDAVGKAIAAGKGQ